jgi:hypothetical protein
MQEGLSTRREDKRQKLNDILSVANTVGNIASSGVGLAKAIKGS